MNVSTAAAAGMLALVAILVMDTVSHQRATVSVDGEEVFVVPVYRDTGGDLQDYLEVLKKDSKKGVMYALVSRCASACTLRLASACVYPSTSLGFHSPWMDPNDPDVKAMGPEKSAELLQKAREILRAFYPSKIQAWVDENGALYSKDGFSMSGEEAMKMGVPDCRKIITP